MYYLLKIKKLTRNEEWYTYIFANRSVQPDRFAGYDVVIGPIANDTLYDTLGITTSGFLSKEEALALLQIGPEYFQAVIRTPAALAALTWTGARMLSSEEIRASQAIVRAEAEEYQIAFAQMLEKLTDGK